MITRFITAFIVLLIFIPLFICGGFPYQAFVYIASMISLKEFIDARLKKKDIPTFIEFISYVVMSFIVLSNTNSSDLILKIDFRIITGLFLVFLLPIVLYHNQKKYCITDSLYFIGGIFFLGTSFSLLIIFRNVNMHLVTYLLSITIITDTYAYLIGRLIGKHKLLEDISPNKTLEGMIAGTLMGTFVPTLFYITVINTNINILLISVITLFLSILGQFGDLVFSAIKRYYNIKDFSNIMPGHGGMLDRLDSIIFVVLGFVYFISII